MKTNNYETFYKRVRCLFPSIGFKEGKFLRELRFNLRDYSFSHPNSTYEDIVDFFGSPEEIMINYVESEGIDKIEKRFTIRKYIRLLTYGVFIFLFFIWVTFFLFWANIYHEYTSQVPAYGEVTIKEGVVKP
ncbi:MAG TPA: hypothetical protein IAA00_15005 [Candidatus Blautia ornithocaccae]|nr:hypothetical protein [Candidatus Blautia ornithocaccae]